VHFYFDKEVKKSELELFNDDGLSTTSIEKSVYEEFDFESAIDKNSLFLDIEFDKTYSTTTSKKINIIIHGFDKNPTTILLNDKILNNNQYKFENNLIYISLQCELDNNKKIEIKL
jgi:hypothetical protein